MDFKDIGCGDARWVERVLPVLKLKAPLPARTLFKSVQ
jgi:hypothetical protein